jgi:outer membrane protein assembly factor BamB
MQWGANPQHTGSLNAVGQVPNRIVADFVFDPFVAQELADSPLSGVLIVHYQAPLTKGEDVFMEFKTGRWISCNPAGSGTPFPCGRDAWNSQIWNERKLHWSNGKLSLAWNFQSDWKPEPEGHGLGSEPVFHAALSNGFVYVPGLGGAIWKLQINNGTVARHIMPFGATLNPNTFVAGPLTADTRGNIYYTAMKLSNPRVANPWFASDVLGAWMVKIGPDDSVKVVRFRSLFPSDVALPTLCDGVFTPQTDPLPWPPSPDSHPPQSPCGSQRPGVNVAPALSPNGTIYLLSRAHFNDRYSYLVAVNPDLTPKWAASLRGRLSDGCGIALPFGTVPTQGVCRPGTATGVDPATNDTPAGKVLDSSTSSPVVLPDGTILYGAHTKYNGGRGHLMKFSAQGQFLAAFDFGWDSTPAVYRHDGTYSIITKDNHYDGTFYITQLDPDLKPDWKFENTNTLACRRNADGTLSCVDTGSTFEWCINAPAVDKNGVVYVQSEDGNLYTIGQGHSGEFTIPLHSIFERLALGAAYTPLSLGTDGTIYSENAGHLLVIKQ